MLWPVGKYFWEKRQKSEDFSITVPGVDNIYPDLHEWVLERIPKDERKALIATTSLGDYSSDEDEVRLRYDGSRIQDVTIDGHEVTVAVERENIPERVNLPENWRQFMEKITFTARTSKGRDAVIQMIDGLVKAREDEDAPPALYIPSRWGGEWNRRGDVPPRTMESTILKQGQLERLTADLGQFLDAEDEYNRLSQPWHRGYLLHGAPGTGKTSVARALAYHFGLTTYYLPLGDISSDTNLMSFIANIEPRSVLLLEDVDVYHAATERNEQKDKVSVAAMLNALDGIWTPHGLITIMTTNNREALDEALIRAGRIDVHEEFTVLDADQAQRIGEFFESSMDTSGFVGSSPSELIEALSNERRQQNDNPQTDIQIYNGYDSTRSLPSRRAVRSRQGATTNKPVASGRL